MRKNANSILGMSKRNGLKKVSVNRKTKRPPLLRFSFTNCFVAICSKENAIRIFMIVTQKAKKAICFFAARPPLLRFSFTNCFVAICSKENAIRIFMIVTQKPKKAIRFFAESRRFCVFRSQIALLQFVHLGAYRFRRGF